jgi:hypothetical protein
VSFMCQVSTLEYATKKPKEGHSTKRWHNFLKMEFFCHKLFFCQLNFLKTICLKVICVLTFMFISYNFRSFFFEIMWPL